MRLGHVVGPMLEVRGMARDEKRVATAHLVRVGVKVREQYIGTSKPGAVWSGLGLGLGLGPGLGLGL